MNDTGRKHNVYCKWPARNLLHEVMLTEELLPFWDLKILRGNQVDPHLKPDATIQASDFSFHFEMDMDTEGYKQVQTQMRRYEKANEYVVWFAPTMTRLQGLMKVASKKSMFSLHGTSVWFDAEQKKLTVEQAREIFDKRGA